MRCCIWTTRDEFDGWIVLPARLSSTRIWVSDGKTIMFTSTMLRSHVLKVRRVLLAALLEVLMQVVMHVSCSDAALPPSQHAAQAKPGFVQHTLRVAAHQEIIHDSVTLRAIQMLSRLVDKEEF